MKTYEEFQGVRLHKDLVAQYTVLGFPDMLLSPQSWKIGSGSCAVCTHCKVQKKVLQANSKNPYNLYSMIQLQKGKYQSIIAKIWQWSGFGLASFLLYIL